MCLYNQINEENAMRYRIRHSQLEGIGPNQFANLTPSEIDKLCNDIKIVFEKGTVTEETKIDRLE